LSITGADKLFDEDSYSDADEVIDSLLGGTDDLVDELTAKEGSSSKNRSYRDSSGVTQKEAEKILNDQDQIGKILSKESDVRLLFSEEDELGQLISGGIDVRSIVSDPEALDPLIRYDYTSDDVESLLNREIPPDSAFGSDREDRGPIELVLTSPLISFLSVLFIYFAAAPVAWFLDIPYKGSYNSLYVLISALFVSTIGLELGGRVSMGELKLGVRDQEESDSYLGSLLNIAYDFCFFLREDGFIFSLMSNAFVGALFVTGVWLSGHRAVFEFILASTVISIFSIILAFIGGFVAIFLIALVTTEMSEDAEYVVFLLGAVVTWIWYTWTSIGEMDTTPWLGHFFSGSTVAGYVDTGIAIAVGAVGVSTFLLNLYTTPVSFWSYSYRDHSSSTRHSSKDSLSNMREKQKMRTDTKTQPFLTKGSLPGLWCFVIYAPVAVMLWVLHTGTPLNTPFGSLNAVKLLYMSVFASGVAGVGYISTCIIRVSAEKTPIFSE
jgi:hypothetical protein